MIIEDPDKKKELDKIPDVDKNGDPIYKIDSNEPGVRRTTWITSTTCCQHITIIARRLVTRRTCINSGILLG